MRNYLLIIFGLFCIQSASAESDKWLENWIDYWNIYEAGISRAETERILINSGFDVKSLIFSEKPVSLDSLMKYFHPVYLNEDNQVDFIYNGTDGAGGDLTAIIFNDGGDLQILAKYFATVSNFIYRYPFSPSYLILTEYGCCGFLQQFKYDVIIMPQKDSVSIIEGEKICFNKFTGFPEIYTMNQPVTIVEDTEALKSLEFKEGRQGDFLCTIKSGEKGFALAEGTDPGGKLYYFCILYNNTEKDSNCFLQTEDFEFYGKYFAWIAFSSVQITSFTNQSENR